MWVKLYQGSHFDIYVGIVGFSPYVDYMKLVTDHLMSSNLIYCSQEL